MRWSKLKTKIINYRNKLRKYLSNYPNRINNITEGNQKIIEMIESEKPFMITRIGETELSCIVEYEKKKVKLISGNNKIVWDEKTIYKMRNNAGFFPTDSSSLMNFSDFFIKCILESDFMGVWYNKKEDEIISKYSDKSFLAELRSLEPYYNLSNPWSKALLNKKVLVIHPYAESIKKQHANKDKIFPGTNVLPDFEIQVMQSVQSIAGNNPEGFKSWFDALEYMKNEINKIDFDIAIIGAGAYGLPLASYIKSIGKQAIHLGGSTQIMFGIKGKRWDEHPYISKLYNENWVNPSNKEIPKNHTKVEGGCYW